MHLREVFSQTHQALNTAGVDHALIGGMAMSLWGLARATGDVDYLIEAEHREIATSSLVAIGYIVTNSNAEIVQLSGAGRVDFLCASRALSRQMLADAKILPNLGLKYLLAEDLIGLKIQAYTNDPRRSLQDKADIQNLMRKNPNLDMQRIKKYADMFHAWETVKNLGGDL